MAFRRLGGGQWTKWPTKDTPAGEVVTGRIKSTERGEYGPMCILENEDGEFLITGKSFYHATCSFDEEGELVDWKVTPGQVVRITYEGLKPTKKGNPMKAMIVEIEEPGVPA